LLEIPLKNLARSACLLFWRPIWLHSWHSTTIMQPCKTSLQGN